MLGSMIGVYYPITGKHRIDETIQDKVEEIKRDFDRNNRLQKIKRPTRQKAQLKIEYSSYLINGDYYSVVLQTYEKYPKQRTLETHVYSLVFQVSNEKKLQLKDVLKGRYLNVLSKKGKHAFENRAYLYPYRSSSLVQQELQPHKGNFENFACTKEGIEIWLPSYPIATGIVGYAHYLVPYVELAGYVQPQLVNIGIEDNKQSFIDNKKPMVAISYDDGPHKENTPKILDILKQNNACATFFVLGKRVQHRENLLQQMLDQGCEIGNHSWDHKQLTKLSYDQVESEIEDTQNAVFEAVHVYPSLLRPPYGDTNMAVREQINMPAMLWDIDTEDWKNKNAEETARRALLQVKDGDIILMHDIQDSTVEASAKIIPELKNRGFQVVTVSQLFESKGIRLEAGQVYRKVNIVP